VSSSNPEYGFDAKVIPLDVVRLAQRYADEQGGSLGYFGNNASYVKLATGVEPIILFDDPAQAVLSPATRREGCRFLADRRTDWLLVSPTDEKGYGPLEVCGLYAPADVPDIPAGLLFALIR
jgi:hypothetical protein